MSTAPTPRLSPEETARVRLRVRLLIGITARSGRFRSGLALAARRLTPSEAAVIADLERHGLDVVQLREVLRGAHVLVDAPDLYERWRTPKSHARLSSHHKYMDKEQWPDLGMRGPLVREALHGRTPAGTWMQLEKTPASMGARKIPTWTDVLHLWDYVVYRITRSNVGPWGLSKRTEKRPMYLSPDLGVAVPLPKLTSDELDATISRIEADDDTTSASPDLAARFPPPDRADDLLEIAFRPGSASGRGLFGGSDVWITEGPSAVAREALAAESATAPRWTLPDPGPTRAAELRAGDRELRCAVRRAGASGAAGAA